MDDERARLQGLRQQHQRRLQVLEQQAATFGPNARPEVSIEIEDLRTTLVGIDAQLGALAALRLPDPVPDFVGRAEEIERLAQALRAGNGRAAISGVRGLGGVGKTQLAYTIAQRVAGDFPDGQILLGLRGAGTDPMTPNLAIQTVIRAFDRAAQLPDDLPQLQAIYASVLKGKRVLILADDAKEKAQVEPLLPPRGCALLITSRQHFTLPGMTSHELSALPEPDAIALLREICPRIAGGAAQLAKLCGYLPLALRISASLLTNDATLPVARYLARLEHQRLALLRDPDDANADVEASLRLSYDALDPAAQGVLAQLSVFAAPFDLAAAEAVVVAAALTSGVAPAAAGAGSAAATLTPNPSPAAGAGSGVLSTSTAIAKQTDRPSPVATGDKRSAEGGLAGVRDLLGLLYRRSLLEWDAEKQRYRVHDLVRAFGAARLADGEAVWERYARHYAQVARQATELYMQGGTALLAGLSLFDAERLHINLGWNWAEPIASIEADAIVRDYAYLTAYIGILRFDLRLESIPRLEGALAAAKRQGDQSAKGAWLGNLGLVYFNLGEVRRAIEYHEQCLTLMCEIGDRKGEGIALGNLGLAYYNLSEARQAIEYHEQQLAITREISDRRGEGNALGNLGLAYHELGEIQHAITYHEQALAIACNIGDRKGESFALGNLGLTYHDLGEARRAIEYFVQALELARELGDRRGEGIALANLGNAYRILGEARCVIEYHEQSLIISRALGDQRTEGHTLGNLGNAYRNLGELRHAIELYELCLALMRELGDQRGILAALASLGVAYADLGELGRAIEFYEQQLVIVREIGDRRGEANSLFNTSLALDALNQRTEAIAHAEAALPIYAQIESPWAERVRQKLAEWRVAAAQPARKPRKRRGDVA